MAGIVQARVWAEPLMPWRISFNPLNHEAILATMAESIFTRHDGSVVSYKPELSAAILAWEAFARDELLPLCSGRISVANWRVYLYSTLDVAKIKLMHCEHIRCIERIEDFDSPKVSPASPMR